MTEHLMAYEQCHRCRLEHCCSSLGSFLWEDGNTPNDCSQFDPGMESELGFHTSTDITLAAMEELLDALNIDDGYEIGWDGAIQLYLGGQARMHEIQYWDMPKILRILNERGIWPDYIEICSQEYVVPSKQVCLRTLAKLNGNYEALWDRMYDYAMGHGTEGVEE